MPTTRIPEASLRQQDVGPSEVGGDPADFATPQSTIECMVAAAKKNDREGFLRGCAPYIRKMISGSDGAASLKDLMEWVSATQGNLGSITVDNLAEKVFERSYDQTPFKSFENKDVRALFKRVDGCWLLAGMGASEGWARIP